MGMEAKAKPGWSGLSEDTSQVKAKAKPKAKADPIRSDWISEWQSMLRSVWHLLIGFHLVSSNTNNHNIMISGHAHHFKYVVIYPH